MIATARYLSAFVTVTASLLTLAVEQDASAVTRQIDTYTGVEQDDVVSVGAGNIAFLAGAWGNLSQPDAYLATGVDNVLLSHHFFLDMKPNYSTHQAGGAATALAANGGAFNYCEWDHNDGSFGDKEPLERPTYTTNWGCWIVEMDQDENGQKWKSYGDTALVEYEYDSGTGLYNPYIHCYGDSAAVAQCGSYTTLVATHGMGSSTSILTYDLGANQTGEACVIRGVSGVFNSNGTGGVEAYMIGSEWWMTSGANRSVVIDCIK